MATSDERPKTLRVAPRGEPPALARPGGGRAPLLAYVLHSHDWSESSLIVELFTRAQGRVLVAAKGAKRPTSNFRSVLLPFSPLHAQLGRPPANEESEVHALRSAEWAGGTPLLGAAAMFSGFYLNELLLKLLARQDPHPALFDAYADTLAALATLSTLASEGDEPAVLRAFELKLLRELGWLPDLSVATVTAQPLDAAKQYNLHAEAGLGPNTNGLPGAAWLDLEAALAHGSMAALRAACAVAATPLRGMLRAMLDYHLGTTPLRTRHVLQGVQRLTSFR